MRRIKEHCIANGYYDPNSEPDFTQLKERLIKVNQILSDDKELSKYLIYADSENNKFLVNFTAFTKTLKKLSPGKSDNDDIILPELSFLYQDLVGRVEKLINLKERAENQNTPPPTNYQNNLEKKIKELESQVKDLERLLRETSSPAQKDTYKRLLKVFQRDLGDKRREKVKINDPSSNQSDSKPNDKKGLIAIAVGAVVVGLVIICLVAIATNKKREKEYY